MIAAAIFVLACAIISGASDIADAIRDLNNQDETENEND